MGRFLLPLFFLFLFLLFFFFFFFPFCYFDFFPYIVSVIGRHGEANENRDLVG